MSEYIHKSYNVTVLRYHFFLQKYRRAVFDKGVDCALSGVCHEIENRYQIQFLKLEQMRIMFIF